MAFSTFSPYFMLTDRECLGLDERSVQQQHSHLISCKYGDIDTTRTFCLRVQQDYFAAATNIKTFLAMLLRKSSLPLVINWLQACWRSGQFLPLKAYIYALHWTVWMCYAHPFYAFVLTISQHFCPSSSLPKAIIDQGNEHANDIKIATV